MKTHSVKSVGVNSTSRNVSSISTYDYIHSPYECVYIRTIGETLGNSQCHVKLLSMMALYQRIVTVWFNNCVSSQVIRPDFGKIE